MRKIDKLKNKVKNNIFELYKYIDTKNYFLLFIWFILTCIVGSLPSFTVYINKSVINSLTKLSEEFNDLYFRNAVLFLVVLSLIELLIEVIEKINLIIYKKIGDVTTQKLQTRFYEAISLLSADQFEDFQMYKKITMATNGLGSNGIDILQKIATIIASIFSVFSLFAVLYYVHWLLPLVIILSGVPAFIALLINKNYRYHNIEKLVEKQRKHFYLTSLFTDKEAVKELKIFNCFRFLIKRWEKEDSEILGEEMSVQKHESILSIVASSIAEIATLGVMLWLINKMADGELSIGDYVSLIGAISILQTSLGELSGCISEIYESNKYLAALFEILHLDDKKMKKMDEAEAVFHFENMVIKNLNFRYPSSNSNILKKINCTIESGDHIAIIGHNGSGKTTLANLLMGVYEKYDGTIIINNKVLEGNIRQQYQKNVACILQNFIKYEMSLRENIVMGNLDEYGNDKRIIEIMQMIGLNIDNQNGLETILSPLYQNGTELSGGEWQKIAMGRALIKDAEVFCFDEPTASLDPEAESKFYSNLTKVIEDKTYIIVSHRLGVTKFCNKIIVMNEGEIAEIGTHEDLLEKRGIYYRLYTMQSDLYV